MCTHMALFWKSDKFPHKHMPNKPLFYIACLYSELVTVNAKQTRTK